MPHDNVYLSGLFGLKDRIAIVTGGMGKLGSGYVQALARAGARVAIFDVVDTPPVSLQEFSADHPILFFNVDIRKEDEVVVAVEKIKSRWGTPTILVNNAGWRASPNEASRASVPFENYPMDVWNEVFEINMAAAAVCAKSVGHHLIEDKKPGVIINIASHYGLVSPDQRIYDYRIGKGKGAFVKDASYSASKAAMIAFTRDLATQWASHGIRVVAFAPGGVFNSKSDDEFVQNYSFRVPLGRMARADEYNGIIVFLASDAASYMTGTCVVADGGWTAW